MARKVAGECNKYEKGVECFEVIRQLFMFLQEIMLPSVCKGVVVIFVGC